MNVPIQPRWARDGICSVAVSVALGACGGEPSPSVVKAPPPADPPAVIPPGMSIPSNDPPAPEGPQH
jgi:hypothetical protein